jgi:Mismatch repair ATPase (MutS family)
MEVIELNNNALKTLEYEKVKEGIESFALSERGREMVRKLEPSIDIVEIERWMKETTESKNIVNISSSIPIHSLKGIDSVISKLGKGSILNVEDFAAVYGLLIECKKLKKFMADKDYAAPMVSSYALSIFGLDDLEEEIDRCIRNGVVDDGASPELARIRKKIVILQDKIKEKIEGVLRNPAYRPYLQDNVIGMRSGRYVIPVRSEYRKQIDGEVLDTSASGSTVFIEPREVRKTQDELNVFKIQEENEVYRILSTLTVMVDGYERELKINVEIMANYDFLFAKAKYSKAVNCSPAVLNNQRYTCIKNGRHPLIESRAVPLNFSIGGDYRALVITGPNTGGKTVALKTVGLLTIMAQSGLHIPADDGSEIAVYSDILADIGDGQSIEQSLSTFSAHIKNIIGIVECADSHTLVIMDELGAGTDPGEGMGLAVAVLEKVYEKGATILATTHYSEIKNFASSHEGFKNGCMEFDINTLKPLYRLAIGRPGESNAFLIALRLGMDDNLIKRAHYVTYNEDKDYSVYKGSSPVEKINDGSDQKHHEDTAKGLEQTVKIRQKQEKQAIPPAFKIGDCVYISSMGRTGIICELENNRGEFGVMVMKKKFRVNKKRLSLYIDSKEMYPEDYDFDIVFESKENRKKDKIMGKHHVEGLTIEVKKI